MKEEVISSGTVEVVALARSSSPPTPAANSAAASSHVAPINAGSTDWLGSAHGSKAGSLSSAAAQAPWTSLSNNFGNSSPGSLEILCRPWERGDLLRRLATFEPSNWFAKPKGASSLSCARRGWVNVGNGKIECELCGSFLTFTKSVSRTIDGVDHDGEAFTEKLDSGHKVTCPWKGNCCADSLVQFPPTPASALIGSYKDRCDGLLQFPCLPLIASSAIETMKLSRCAQIERILSQSLFSSGEMGFKTDSMPIPEISREDPFFHHTQAQKLISLCGWEPRWLPNVQDCEEYSAQSARNGCSFGPNEDGYPYARCPEPTKHALSASAEQKRGKEKLVEESWCDMRSPLLDCSLCGATIRVCDFLTVPQQAPPGSNNINNTDNCKKITPTHGTSAASGINGGIGVGGMERDQMEDRDEAATTDEKKSPSNAVVNLNLNAAEGFPSNMPAEGYPLDDSRMGIDLTLGQPAGSEVGDRAASFESRGPSSRKRSLEDGGSTVDRPQDRIQQADSIEGTVVNRDDDEVDGGTHESDGLSKRARRLDVFHSQDLSNKLNSSGAGPSHGYLDLTINRLNSFKDGSDIAVGHPNTRNSAHASSVVAMDTIYRSDDEDSMESVENCPGDVDYVNFNYTNGASEFDNSNLAQQSTCLPHGAGSVAREMGGSSTIEGEEVLNAETFTVSARDRFSLGISAGSVGVGASHEAEIHGIDISLRRTYSAVGEVGLIAEVTENMGQSGESAPGPGLMDEFVPDEILREGPHSDMQDMISRSVEKADSGSKVYGSIKADSIESGEKMSHTLGHESSAHPSLSCNAMICSANEISRGEVMQTGKETITYDCALVSDNVMGISSGPQNEENNYRQEAGEFDPIKHHNIYCPWVNGNVAAAGFSSDIATDSSGTAALSGWQLTLDALDAFQTLGQIPNQMMRSESAASLYKDDHLTPGQKILTRQSVSKSRRKRFD
ncbi:hypothetical protein KFK09_016288 [Dendrobium nobile]|uniref:C3HC-type domain-containing protein n=1 Tax=Dendrobium nobile TaxID=94219 RepID=A0A8T3AZ54_DENNO|nr:hypothetical protein KFK09_016288 [Dendrobium nobile]